MASTSRSGLSLQHQPELNAKRTGLRGLAALVLFGILVGCSGNASVDELEAAPLATNVQNNEPPNLPAVTQPSGQSESPTVAAVDIVSLERGSSLRDTAIAEHLAGRFELALYSFGLGESLMESLPSVTYTDVETGIVVPSAATSFVVGTVSGVVAGRFFANTELEEGPDVVEVTEAEAHWQTLHIHIDPLVQTGARGHQRQSDERVTIGLAVSADPDQRSEFISELREAGSIAAVLWDSAVFSYDPNVSGVFGDGMLLGQVEPDGSVAFHLAPPAVRSQLGLDKVDLGALLEAAQQERVIPVLSTDRGPVRVDVLERLAAEGADLTGSFGVSSERLSRATAEAETFRATEGED